MSKQWTLSGKSISDFTSKIDYRMNNLQDRLDLVRQVLGEENIFYNDSILDEIRKYDNFFSSYFFPDEFVKKPKITETVYDTSLAYKTLDELEHKDNLTKKQSKQYLEILELTSLLEMATRSFEEETRLTKLANKYCEKHREVISYEYHGEYNNYTPHIGTANEVNMKQVVSNLKPLSENDYICRALESMGSYLIRQAEKEEKEANKNNPEYELSSPTLSKRDKKKNEKKEQLEDSTETEWQKRGEPPTSKKNQIILSKYDICVSDRDYIIGGVESKENEESKFPHFLNIDRSETRLETENKMKKLLTETGESLALLRKLMETKQHIGTFKEIDRKDLYKIQLWIGDIIRNEIEIYKSQHRFVDFKKLEKGFSQITLDDNTGYIGRNVEIDFYCLVSNNKFEFSKKEHIASLIKVYPDIADYEDRVETDLYHLMLVFKRIINIAKYFNILDSYEVDILDWHMKSDLPATMKDDTPSELKCDTIKGLLLSEHNLDWAQSRISDTLNHRIPEKLQKVYKQWYETWAYTYRIKGKYKQCKGSCGKNRLELPKYFRQRSNGKYYNQCRKCESKK